MTRIIGDLAKGGFRRQDPQPRRTGGDRRSYHRRRPRSPTRRVPDPPRQRPQPHHEPSRPQGPVVLRRRTRVDCRRSREGTRGSVVRRPSPEARSSELTGERVGRSARGPRDASVARDSHRGHHPCTDVVQRGLHAGDSETLQGPGRLSLWINRATRRTFFAVSRLADTYERKDAILAPIGPIAVLAQLVVWLVLLGAGFTVMLVPYTHDLGAAVSEIGAAMFTLGLARSARFTSDTIVILASASGFVVIALQIAYLPRSTRPSNPPRVAHHHACQPSR